jgi:glyoxylase-like metal-dependent hydrolase (beta-lactamase superfamily II)
MGLLVRRGVRGAVAFALAVLAPVTVARAQIVSRRPVPTYEVYALRYASIPFQVSNLIAGADTSRHLDIAMIVLVLKGSNGRTVLLDAGFYRDKFMTRWKPQEYVRPDSAVLKCGVKPEDITDVIVSHIHWDHFDGADLFPKAKVWIQKDEIEHHVDSAGRVLANAIDAADAAMLQTLRTAGRIQAVDGDAKEIIPGITVYTGGKHTFQSQYATVHTTEGTVVLASDNAYLYENFEKHVPISQTVDRVSNLAAQDRMKTLASDPRLIVPGHDPAVFTRFTTVAPGVVRIR